MGAYVKNINNFPKTFGEMKYFATLSLSLSLIAPLIFSF